MAIDWGWCHRNPREAAAEIIRLNEIIQMPRIQINFNQVVRVKLTEVGLQRYRAISQEIPSTFDPKIDENGYYHIELWQLMRDYGDLLNNAGYPPFDIEAILFESPSERN